MMTIKRFLKNISYHKWSQIRDSDVRVHLEGGKIIDLGQVYFTLLYCVGGVEWFLKAVKYADWKDKVTSIQATWPGQRVPLHLDINSFKEISNV